MSFSSNLAGFSFKHWIYYLAATAKWNPFFHFVSATVIGIRSWECKMPTHFSFFLERKGEGNIYYVQNKNYKTKIPMINAGIMDFIWEVSVIIGCNPHSLSVLTVPKSFLRTNLMFVLYIVNTTKPSLMTSCNLIWKFVDWYTRTTPAVKWSQI